MAGFTEEQAKAYITKLLTAMSQAGGSDLFVSEGLPAGHEAAGQHAAPDESEALGRSVARAGLRAHEPASDARSSRKSWSAISPSRCRASRVSG